MPLRTIRVVEMAGAIGKVRYIRAVISDHHYAKRQSARPAFIFVNRVNSFD
ncbi:hypothetical protein QTS50_001715 [Salmonella enterica]|nr:hypothetical protein [Salmonella enterica]